MDKLKRLFTNWWFYLILFVITIGIPFLINEAYKIDKGYITLWKAEDALSFYGSYLSFIGTVILGLVAVYQNKKAHQLNEQMQKLQQVQFISMVSVSRLELNKSSVETPNYLNTDMRDIDTIIDLTQDGVPTHECYHIDIEFMNDSDFPIVQIEVHPGRRKSGNGIVYGMVELLTKAIYIPARKSRIIRIIVPSMIFERKKSYQLVLSIEFYNVFNYCTSATINIEDLENQTQRNRYSFRLAKFTDIRPNSNNKNKKDRKAGRPEDDDAGCG